LRRILNTVVLLAGLLAPAQVARAQEVYAYLGFGGAYAKSNGSRIDTFGDGTLHATPSLDGVFTELGASVFVNKNWGFGAALAWRPSEGEYAGVPYRPTFYNFDGIFRPVSRTSKRFAPEFRAGIGAAKVHYDPNDPTNCDQIPGCPDSAHFQAHLAVAARWYSPADPKLKEGQSV
jgi:hypothetical protein